MYYIFKNEDYQDLTAMFSLHLDQLLPKHSVAFKVAGEKNFSKTKFLKEKKDKFQND